MLPLIMAAAGLLKAETIDRQKEKRQRQLAANTQRLSPWTGLKAQPIEEADPLGSAMAFGMSGAGLDQNMADRDMRNKLTDAQINYLNASGGPQEVPVIPPAMDDTTGGTGTALGRPWGYRQKRFVGGYEY